MLLHASAMLAVMSIIFIHASTASSNNCMSLISALYPWHVLNERVIARACSSKAFVSIPGAEAPVFLCASNALIAVVASFQRESAVNSAINLDAACCKATHFSDFKEVAIQVVILTSSRASCSSEFTAAANRFCK